MLCVVKLDMLCWKTVLSVSNHHMSKLMLISIACWWMVKWRHRRNNKKTMQGCQDCGIRSELKNLPLVSTVSDLPFVWQLGMYVSGHWGALCLDLLSRMSPRPWARSRSFSRVTSSLSSRTSFALGSSLMTALHLICLALSAYLWMSKQRQWSKQPLISQECFYLEQESPLKTIRI